MGQPNEMPVMLFAPQHLETQVNTCNLYRRLQPEESNQEGSDSAADNEEEDGDGDDDSDEEARIIAERQQECIIS